MWESFNRLTEITQLCRWVKTETGLFFFTRSPGENSPTSRHKPIKADEKAVIYQAIMLRLHTCVPEEKKKKERMILSRQTLDICWIRQYILKKKWITFIYSHSNLSLFPVYQPVLVRRDAHISLIEAYLSIPHATKIKKGCVGLGQERGHYCFVKGTEDISVLLRGRDEQRKVHERGRGRYTSRRNHSNPLKGKTSFPVSQ